MFIRLISIVQIVLFAACGPQFPDTYQLEGEVLNSQDNTLYAPTDLQKMNWLAGVWQWQERGTTHAQTYTFLPGNQLKIVDNNATGGKGIMEIFWQEGCFVFGKHQPWKITWIGEKDVRLDPLTPDLQPMTWTRLNENTWHLIRHTHAGDQVTVMTRMGSVPS